MKTRHPEIPELEITRVEEGLFVAACPELHLSTEGATAAEAEDLLIRLLEERTQQGAPQPTEDLYADPDDLVEEDPQS